MKEYLYRLCIFFRGFKEIDRFAWNEMERSLRRIVNLKN